MTSIETEMALLKSHIEETTCNVKMLVKVITIGNGMPSLMSRIDAIETQSKWIPSLITYMNKSKGAIALICVLGVGGLWALVRSFI